jgi:hypothetical protein
VIGGIARRRQKLVCRAGAGVWPHRIGGLAASGPEDALEFVLDDGVVGVAGGDDLTGELRGHDAKDHGTDHEGEDEGGDGAVHGGCFIVFGVMKARIPAQA